MSEIFLYLTTTGWKTGQPHEIEIWFVEHEGKYYMVSEGQETAHWVKNIKANPQVHFSVGVREDKESVLPRTPAVGALLNAPDEADLIRTVQEKMNAKYNWSSGLIVQLTPAATPPEDAL